MIYQYTNVKKYIFLGLILGCIGFSSEALAQETESTTTESLVKNLESILVPFGSSETADSAAFSILGIPRSDVALPSSNPTKFGLTLLESISNSNGDFLGNFGFEIAPYYWFDNTLGLEEYLKMNQFGQSILPTLSLSIATADVEIPEDGVMVDSTRLGIGLRTKLLSGQPSSEIDGLIEDYRKVSAACLKEIIERDGFLEVDENGNFINDFPPERLTNTKDCSSATQRDELGERIRNLTSDLRGLEIALATGGAFDVPGDDWSEVEFSRASASVTVGFRPTITINKKDGDPKTKIQKPSALEFLGVTRYIYDDFDGNSESVFDIGAKALWQIDRPLIVSAEYVRRFGESDDERLVGIVEYRFNQQYSLFASFGKNFDESFSGDGDLVTLLGINFGLGRNFLNIKEK